MARSLVLLAVVAGASYAFVFPTRTYLQQQHAIAAERQVVATLRSEDSKLAAEVKSLHSDATIERLARQEFGLVSPGQQAFSVLPSPPAPAPRAPRAMAKHTPWYSYLELWRYL